MIKAITIDVGGVIATNPPRHIIREIALKHDLDVEAVHKAWNAHWHGFITGNLTEAQFYEFLVRDLYIEGDRQAFINETVEIAREFLAIIPEHVELFKSLKTMMSKKQAFPIALLSNNSREWWTYLKEDHDLSVFAPQVLSFEEHCAKPDEKLFAALLDKLKLKPEEVLFVDDKASHCDAATRIGMNAHTFTTPEAFVTYLHELKITTDTEHKKLLEEAQRAGGPQ